MGAQESSHGGHGGAGAPAGRSAHLLRPLSCAGLGAPLSPQPRASLVLRALSVTGKPTAAAAGNAMSGLKSRQGRLRAREQQWPWPQPR